jgi:phage antirepressor YoqD-like protein
MSSLDLLETINLYRGRFQENEVRRSDFHNRVDDELEGEYYETFVVSNPRGPASKAYRLTRDQCALVAMRESKAVRRSALAELKKMDSPELPNFNDPVVAARAWADAKESEQKALVELERAKPAVEFVDRYTDSTGLVSLTQAAKDLHFKPRQFTSALQRDGYLYRTGGALTPYQRYLDQGLFQMVVGERGGHGYSQTKVTTKGKAYFAQRYASEL